LRSGGSSPQLQLVNPRVHPSVRRGGAPGRRSHTSMTRWAFLHGTVRIGAGAGRKGPHTRRGDTDRQNSQGGRTEEIPAPRRKGTSEANPERKTGKLLEKKNCSPHHAAIDNPHRRCSAWLALQPLLKWSNDRRNFFVFTRRSFSKLAVAGSRQMYPGRPMVFDVRTRRLAWGRSRRASHW